MNNFKTVKIGKQTWMAENLNVDDGGEGIYKNPENNEVCYTWDAAMRVAKGIPGWHLPTVQEWREAALACGATEKMYADNPNYNDYWYAQELKDKLGVKLVGILSKDSFYGADSYASFWTATENSSIYYAYSRNFSTDASMDSNKADKTYYAYSVRLVKDN